MKVLIGLAFCVALAAQQQPAASASCALEGKALNAATGAAVANAAIVLRRGTQPVYVTESDDSGAYAFAGIDPGQYTLSAERAAFVTANYGAGRPGAVGAPIALSPAEKATGLDFRLTPAGVIAGKARDADGQPFVSATIHLLRQSYVNGRKQLTDARPAVSVDDVGGFRFAGLAPGRYYIRAEYTDVNETGLRGRYQALGTQQQIVPIYYLSTSDQQKAEPLEIKPGDTISDAYVTLFRTPLVTVPVRGVVGNIAGLTVDSRLSVMFYRPDGGPGGSATVNTQTGEFEIRGGAPPGKYAMVFVAYDRLIPTPGYFARREVELNGSPLSITLSPSLNVTGAVRVEDGSGPVNLRQVRVVLRPADLVSNVSDQMMPAQQPGADGKFSISRLPPDRYSVNISGLPSGAYVKSIRLGEEDALDNGVDLTRDVRESIDIVLSAKSGALKGTVTDEKGAPAAGAKVALVPQDSKLRKRSECYWTATTDKNGKFTLSGVRPERYQLFAWDDVEDGAWMDPEFLKPIEAQAKDVTVTAGDDQSVEAKLVR